MVGSERYRTQVCVPDAQWGQKIPKRQFGAEKGILQGHARRWVAQGPPNPELPVSFQQNTFIGNVREGCS